MTNNYPNAWSVCLENVCFFGLLRIYYSVSPNIIFRKLRTTVKNNS